MTLPVRKHPAHGVNERLDVPTVVFLTVCTKNRIPWLANSEVHALLRSVWQEATKWLVGNYTVLPDHIHLFAAPNLIREGEAPAEPVPFDNWVRYWKSQFTKQHAHPSHRWQTDHWDRRLRKEESYADKWEYVRNNPVRHGLVAKVDDWKFQGKIHEIVW